MHGCQNCLYFGCEPNTSSWSGTIDFICLMLLPLDFKRLPPPAEIAYPFRDSLQVQGAKIEVELRFHFMMSTWRSPAVACIDMIARLFVQTSNSNIPLAIRLP